MRSTVVMGEALRRMPLPLRALTLLSLGGPLYALLAAALVADACAGSPRGLSSAALSAWALLVAASLPAAAWLCLRRNPFARNALLGAVAAALFLPLALTACVDGLLVLPVLSILTAAGIGGYLYFSAAVYEYFRAPTSPRENDERSPQ